MPKFGSDADGFSVTFEDASRSLRVKAWGFWGPEVAASFATTVIDACRSARRATEVVVDATDLKPQRDEGQLALTTFLGALPGLGITQASIVTANPLTKLQLMRIAGSTASKSIIQFTSKAGA
jgi:hypothetical protein